MSDKMVFDPDHPDLLFDWFQQQVGSLYVSDAYNAWIFLDDERRVVDFWLSDVNGEWVGSEDVPSEFGTPAFDQLIEQARKRGVTNIIGVHHHTLDTKPGPCEGIIALAAEVDARLTEAGLHLRAFLLPRGSLLDGVMYGERVAPDGDIEREIVEEGEQLREFFAARAAQGDETAVSLLAVIDEILNSIREERTPNFAAVEEGLRIVQRDMDDPFVSTIIEAMLASAPKQPLKKRSILDLPELDLRKMDYLN